jgi:hypothetical protein
LKVYIDVFNIFKGIQNSGQELKNVFDEARNILTEHLNAGGDVLKG